MIFVRVLHTKEELMAELNLSAPWVIYAHKVEAMFERDPEVNVTFDAEACVLKVFVDNQRKADALARILPTSVTFGNVTLAIQVIPANDDVSRIELFQRAFEGNDAFGFIDTVVDPHGFEQNVMLLKPEVVQFFDDDISSVFGLYTGTYEQVVKDVFEGCADDILISSARKEG